MNVDWLRGVKYRDGSSQGLTRLSMMGGAEVFIEGAGLHDEPQRNAVLLDSNDIEGLKLTAPALTCK